MTTEATSTAQPPSDPGAPLAVDAKLSVSETKRQIRVVQIWLFGLSGLLPIAGLILLFLYSRSLRPNAAMEMFAPVAMVAVASMLLGGLLGFLFAVPRSQSPDQSNRAADAERPFITNSNLEQISDWLTKIIVGITLIQLNDILARLGQLTNSLAAMFGSEASGATAIAAATIAYFPTLGFLIGYLATRSIITVLFGLIHATLSDLLDEHAQQHKLSASDIMRQSR